MKQTTWVVRNIKTGWDVDGNSRTRARMNDGCVRLAIDLDQSKPPQMYFARNPACCVTSRQKGELAQRKLHANKEISAYLNLTQFFVVQRIPHDIPIALKPRSQVETKPKVFFLLFSVEFMINNYNAQRAVHICAVLYVPDRVSR